MADTKTYTINELKRMVASGKIALPDDNQQNPYFSVLLANDVPIPTLYFVSDKRGVLTPINTTTIACVCDIDTSGMSTAVENAVLRIEVTCVVLNPSTKQHIVDAIIGAT